jgi:hypothetical protein
MLGRCAAPHRWSTMFLQDTADPRDSGLFADKSKGDLSYELGRALVLVNPSVCESCESISFLLHLSAQGAHPLRIPSICHPSLSHFPPFYWHVLCSVETCQFPLHLHLHHPLISSMPLAVTQPLFSSPPDFSQEHTMYFLLSYS